MSKPKITSAVVGANNKPCCEAGGFVIRDWIYILPNCKRPIISYVSVFSLTLYTQNIVLILEYVSFKGTIIYALLQLYKPRRSRDKKVDS